MFMQYNILYDRISFITNQFILITYFSIVSVLR